MKDILKNKLIKRSNLAILKDADSLMKLSTNLMIAVVTGMIISPLVILFSDSLNGAIIEPSSFLGFAKGAGFWIVVVLEIIAIWIIITSKKQALEMYDFVERREQKTKH